MDTMFHTIEINAVQKQFRVECPDAEAKISVQTLKPGMESGQAPVELRRMMNSAPSLTSEQFLLTPYLHPLIGGGAG